MIAIHVNQFFSVNYRWKLRFFEAELKDTEIKATSLRKRTNIKFVLQNISLHCSWILHHQLHGVNYKTYQYVHSSEKVTMNKLLEAPE